jgi:cell wall-associated NlpC family hydrolase
VTLVALPGTASAQPTPAQMTRLVAATSHQLEVVGEQVNKARVDLAAQQAAAGRAKTSADRAEARLDDMRAQVRQIARSAYTTGDVSRLDVLLTSRSPQEILSRMGTLDAIAGHQVTVLQQTSQRAREARQARVTADRAAATAKKTLEAVTAQQSRLKSRIASYQREYARLTAAQRRAVAERVAGRAVAAPVRPAAVHAATVRTATAHTAAAPAAPVAASSGAAQVAVRTALAQVGKPYVWGASGPNAFDCSGLMMYAYAAAGVALPHSSSVQATMGTPVSRDQLQPGDLVFFYSPVSHVGMYIGNGQMVHASTEGVPVQVVDLGSMPGYNSARRIG